MTKIFYDSEFIERGPEWPIQLVSIGMVRDDGAEYYAVSDRFDFHYLCGNEWLAANVLPHIPHVTDEGGYWLDASHPAVKPREQIAEDVAAFVLGVSDPELWADYCSYDHVVLCQLFGRMVDLPKGMPMFTRDVKDFSIRVGDPRWPAQETAAHHALNDAKQSRDVWKFLRGIEIGAYAAPQPEAAP